MWRRLKTFLSSTNSPGPEQSDALVPDDQYDFMFGTKPKLPEGLSDLNITELRRGLLVLENFHVPLTVDQTYMDDTAERIAMASRCLPWAKTYHDLDTAPHPPVTLHNGNVLITASHYLETNNQPEVDVAEWLRYAGWNESRPFRAQQAISNTPLEDGFFSCLRIIVGNMPDESEEAITWAKRECGSGTVVAGLGEFAREEFARLGGHSCEAFLSQTYSDTPAEQLTHPVFSLLDFPCFDMGTVKTSFAGSVWSEQEIRFWSRPTYFHK